MWQLFNSGQLNQAAVQQLAQAVFGVAQNGAVVSQGNLAGRKLLTAQFGSLISALNAGQLNQAAVQQLAQAGFFGTAVNGAVVSQGNLAGAAPRPAPAADLWCWPLTLCGVHA